MLLLGNKRTEFEWLLIQNLSYPSFRMLFDQVPALLLFIAFGYLFVLDHDTLVLFAFMVSYRLNWCHVGR